MKDGNAAKVIPSRKEAEREMERDLASRSAAIRQRFERSRAAWLFAREALGFGRCAAARAAIRNFKPPRRAALVEEER